MTAFNSARRLQFVKAKPDLSFNYTPSSTNWNYKFPPAHTAEYEPHPWWELQNYTA